MNPEIEIGMVIEDPGGYTWEITEVSNGNVELDGEHYVSYSTLATDIRQGKTEVIENA